MGYVQKFWTGLCRNHFFVTLKIAKHLWKCSKESKMRSLFNVLALAILGFQISEGTFVCRVLAKLGGQIAGFRIIRGQNGSKGTVRETLEDLSQKNSTKVHNFFWIFKNLQFSSSRLNQQTSVLSISLNFFCYFPGRNHFKSTFYSHQKSGSTQQLREKQAKISSTSFPKNFFRALGITKPLIYPLSLQFIAFVHTIVLIIVFFDRQALFRAQKSIESKNIRNLQIHALVFLLKHFKHLKIFRKLRGFLARTPLLDTLGPWENIRNHY